MNRLRRDAEKIWHAGVDAVHASKLVHDCIHFEGSHLNICNQMIDIENTERVLVVGAGKASAAMAEGLENALEQSKFDSKLSGWINVPEPCLQPMRKIHLHPARPAGLNEPTQAGVEGTENILRIVKQAKENDVLIVLLSGGGSALLPAPVDGITLDDKQQITRMLTTSGAPIEELNCVRKHLSKVKGGRLIRFCKAKKIISLIISDVIGDPLETIASGPTVEDTTTSIEALGILKRYLGKDIPSNVKHVLEAKKSGDASSTSLLQKQKDRTPKQLPKHPRVIHRIIGSNSTAREAAESMATSMGYHVHSLGSAVEGEAKEIGKQIAKLAKSIREESIPVSPPACIIGGGETTVNVNDVPDPGKGGRNQELALAALKTWSEESLIKICLLAGGTDGEDGPTDAAGAYADEAVQQTAMTKKLDVSDYLTRHDAYSFFDKTEGLFRIEATHSNVMDLWVAVVSNTSDSQIIETR